MSLLEIKHIKKSFGDLEVLKDISLKVDEGEVLAIIGPSGSGKSTLLRLATMLETADSGFIVYAGLPDAVTATKAQKQQIRKYFGLVFQNFNLFPHRSVIQNIMDAPVRIQKKDPEQARSEAMALLKKMGLEGKANEYPQQLSGGQQQRVSIARTLCMEPELILFDEPTSALDPELVGEVLDVMKKLAEEGITMIVVTHEMGFARNVANRVVFINDGVIQENTTPQEFFENPKNERLREFLSKMI